jgi:hypothetical protein
VRSSPASARSLFGMRVLGFARTRREHPYVGGMLTVPACPWPWAKPTSSVSRWR